MRDPYEVLEIDRGASKEEIQKAYRKLVKQYHPDQYHDHPLAGLAEEKLAEINEAYDILMKGGGTSGDYRDNTSSWNQNTQNTSSGNTNSFYQEVRVHINNGDLNHAEKMLDQSNAQTAQWHFLKGVIYQKKGWYSQAMTHLQIAVNMEPGNPEFRSALNAMGYNSQVYRNRSGQYGRNNMDFCDVCQCLICTDCCCECMGGDFIPCC